MLESKSSALPTWLHPKILVAHLGGFEPPAHALEGRCSIQLSYRCLYLKYKIGAGEGNRTLAISLEGWSSTTELHPQNIYGGGDWIRTSESEANGFTVRPL